MDKVLALRGGGEAVALWAQLTSVMDLVSGLALAGIGGGVTVLVAQAGVPERRREILRQGLALSLALSAVPALAGVITAVFLDFGLPRLTVAAAALAGWTAVISGLLNAYWVGRERRDAQLGLAVLSALLAVSAVAWAPSGWMLEWLLVAQAVPALVLFAVWRPRVHPPEQGLRARLLRYVLAGIAIGILGPASTLAARALVASTLSWHDAGVLQALWRVSEWVWGIAAGVLSVLYFAKMSAAYPRGELSAVTRAAERAVLLPSAAFFGALLLAQGPLLGLLYDDTFQVSTTAAAFFFAGGVLRIASWIPLYALYAMSRIWPIAIGELLSVPLFAVLLAAWGESLTLERAGVSWLVAYASYAAFNYWAMKRP